MAPGRGRKFSGSKITLFEKSAGDVEFGRKKGSKIFRFGNPYENFFCLLWTQMAQVPGSGSAEKHFLVDRTTFLVQAPEWS